MKADFIGVIIGRVLCCALLCLLAAPASTAQSRPVVGPDVLVIVLSGLGPMDQVSINYNSLISKADAEADVNSLAAKTSWTVKNLRVTTGGPGDRQTTSSSFETYPLINAAEGTLPIEPFVVTLQRFGTIQVNFIVNSKFDFRGLEEFDDDRVNLNLSRSGYSFEYTARVKKPGFDRLSLPLTERQPAEPKSDRSGAGRLLLIVGLALALAVVGYLVALAVSRRAQA